MTGYLEVAEAREARGLRLVLSRGVPGPWGEAAKNIFNLKGIAYTRVSQYPGQPNAELQAWTGMNNAPIAVLDDEAPVGSWFGIICLAERLQPQPPLIPEDEEERVQMFGLCHEICGEDGLSWNRRLLLMSTWDTVGTKDDEPMRMKIKNQYGHTPPAVRRATSRILAILQHLSQRLHRQRAAGSRYLAGTQITAADVHLSTALALFRPLPPDKCAMHERVRPMYENCADEILAALDPVLFEYRDYQYEHHLALPLDL